jgi:hypothetical protein
MSIRCFWLINSWHNSKGHDHKFQYDLSIVHQPHPKRTIKIKPFLMLITTNIVLSNFGKNTTTVFGSISTINSDVSNVKQNDIGSRKFITRS